MEKDAKGKYLKDSVYGASDGIVTTFAVVAGVSGASLNPSIVLILGFANLIADGFSMAVGNYLGSKSEQEYSKAYLRELREKIERDPTKYKARVKNSFMRKGLTGNLLDQVSDKIFSDKEKRFEIIKEEEICGCTEDDSAIKHSLATFISFVVAGFMPLLIYVLAQFYPSMHETMFLMSIIVTAITLITVGILKSIVTQKSWWKEALQMLIIGGLAAAFAYYVGYLISLVV